MPQTDRDWELIAQQEPFYGVLTNSQFLSANRDAEAERRFWASGERHIARVFANIEEHLSAKFEPKMALEFVCGIGRLLIPLAQKCENITGVDISPTMLDIASAKMAEVGSQNVKLLPDLNTLAATTFDFVHSFIVFQHVPVSRGYQLLDVLLQKLKAGGTGVVHFTFDNYTTMAWMRRVSTWPVAKQLSNILRKRQLNAPVMQMNEYDMNRVLSALHSCGCGNVFIDFTDHGVRGAVLYFKKQEDRIKR